MGEWGPRAPATREHFPSAPLGVGDPRLGPNQQKGVEPQAGAGPENGRGARGVGSRGLGQPGLARRWWRPAWAMGARNATMDPHAASRAAGAAQTAAERRPRALGPAAAAQRRWSGPPPPALRAPGRAARTATGSRCSARPTTVAASWCEVRGGQLAALVPHPTPTGVSNLPATSTSQSYINTLTHHSVIQSVNIILRVHCVLDTELSAADKAASGTEATPISPPFRSPPRAPAPSPKLAPARAEVGVREAESRVPAPRPSRQVRRKASRALRRVKTRRDRSREPRRGESPGSAQRPGRFCASCPASLRIPSGAARAVLPGKDGGTRGWRARRRPACTFAVSAPASSRRSGPAGSRCGLPPAWRFAGPPFSLSLRPPFFLPGRFSPPSSPSQRSLPAGASGLLPHTQLSLAVSPRERGHSAPHPNPQSL